MQVADIRAMFDGISDEWRGLLTRDLRTELSKTIVDVNAKTPDVTKLVPPPTTIMRAFRECPWPPRVVILGQDPYHDGSAMGLAFSVQAGKRIPPSLVNIYKCLRAHALCDVEFSGDLASWSQQGVLLLNTALTTLRGRAGVHINEWEHYTNCVIKKLSDVTPGLVFILLGAHAHKRETLINKHCVVLKWGHPSPLNKVGPPFVQCTAFKLANEYLNPPVDWNSPKPATVTGQTPPTRAIATPTGSVRGQASGTIAIPTPTAPSEPPSPDSAFDDTADEPVEVPRITPFVPQDTVYIFTDGGAVDTRSKNCRASWAYKIVGPNIALTDSGRVQGKQSNQCAELSAIMNGLRRAVELPAFLPIEVITDSKYSIGCLTSWYPKWVRDGTLDGKKNLELISAGHETLQKLGESRVKFTHINSHMDAPADTNSYNWFLWSGNDVVDRACTAVLERQ